LALLKSSRRKLSQQENETGIGETEAKASREIETGKTKNLPWLCARPATAERPSEKWFQVALLVTVKGMAGKNRRSQQEEDKRRLIQIEWGNLLKRNPCHGDRLGKMKSKISTLKQERNNHTHVTSEPRSGDQVTNWSC
jgi:hypothetical protein